MRGCVRGCRWGSGPGWRCGCGRWQLCSSADDRFCVVACPARSATRQRWTLLTPACVADHRPHCSLGNKGNPFNCGRAEAEPFFDRGESWPRCHRLAGTARASPWRRPQRPLPRPPWRDLAAAMWVEQLQPGPEQRVGQLWLDGAVAGLRQTQRCRRRGGGVLGANASDFRRRRRPASCGWLRL